MPPFPFRTKPLVALALSTALLACGDDDVTVDAYVPDLDAGVDASAPTRDAGPPLEPLDRPALPAGNALGPEDPRYQGMLRFLWDNWGVEVGSEWPPADFMLELMEDESFGAQFERFGFVRDPNDDFPVGFKRGLSDPSRVYQTCALCHVGELPDGELWLGLPNDHLDFGAFRVAVNERWVEAGNPSLLTELERDKAGELGPGRFHAESGDYPQVVPADFPPYFHLDERAHLNYLGTGRDVRTEIYMAIFSFGAGNPNDELARVPFPRRERTAQLVEFFSAMDAPPAPDATELAPRGREVFEAARCVDCHVDDPGELGVIPYAPDGVERLPGDDEAFPDGSIATSRYHRILIDGDEMGGGTPSDEGRAALVTFIFRNMLRVSPSDGYRVADLRGAWATAPYLHNGSVPTLEALLTPPEARPSTFDRHGFTVDTTRAGNGNEGHDFGTDLSEADRAALVAYLRTL